MPLEGKRKEALRRKKKGNDCFMTGKFQKALKQYKKGLNALEELFKNQDKMSVSSNEENDTSSNQQFTEEDKKLFVTLQSNSGMMCLKLKNNKEALKHALE